MNLVYVVDQTGKVPFADLQRAVSDIQVQVNEHLAQFWPVKDTTIVAVQNKSEIPAAAWPTYIVDEFEDDGAPHSAYGYHWFRTNSDGSKLPFCVIKYVNNWTVVLSHEVMEMLVNPYAIYVTSADIPGLTEKGVQVLVEVADPVQSITDAYQITTSKKGVQVYGTWVSNFYSPAYFDIIDPNLIGIAKRYDYLGRLTSPKQVLEGGYISYQTRAGEWWQAYRQANVLLFRKLTDSTQSLTASEENRLIRGIGLAVAGLVAVLLLVFGVRHYRTDLQI